ncbi:MAG: hypothetical protein U5K69_03765 [Balneolaceae bacterium]|nr:hypothetical protein [Balneolaceae bacterium]
MNQSRYYSGLIPYLLYITFFSINLTAYHYEIISHTILQFYSSHLLACQTESQYEQLGLEEITITQLQEGYENGDFTIEEVTQAYLAAD